MRLINLGEKAHNKNVGLTRRESRARLSPHTWGGSLTRPSGLSAPADIRPPGPGGEDVDDLVTYHEMSSDYAEPDPCPEDAAAKRRRLEKLDIRAAVTVYKNTDK